MTPKCSNLPPTPVPRPALAPVAYPTRFKSVPSKAKQSPFVTNTQKYYLMNATIEHTGNILRTLGTTGLFQGFLPRMRKATEHMRSRLCLRMRLRMRLRLRIRLRPWLRLGRYRSVFPSSRKAMREYETGNKAPPSCALDLGPSIRVCIWCICAVQSRATIQANAAQDYRTQRQATNRLLVQ